MTMEIIRSATMADLDTLAGIEAACFPAAEAATREDFAGRLAVYPDCFWLLERNGQVVAFLNGMVSDEPAIRDEQYANAALHTPQGLWQTVFGVNTLPENRHQGCAARLMERMIADARAQGRRGCVLTCKEHLIHYYEKFGYRNQGISGSIHGGAVWYDMLLEFPAEK